MMLPCVSVAQPHYQRAMTHDLQRLWQSMHGLAKAATVGNEPFGEQEADFTFIEAFQAQLECSVCLRVFRRPVELMPCSHIFCHDCYLGVLQQRDVRCPNCRVIPRDVREANRLLSNLITALKVRCAVCPWTGSRESFGLHPCDSPSLELLKFQGNGAFAAKRYADAVERYTRAITLAPSHTVLRSNRAQCYLVLGDYTKAEEDSWIALQSDGSHLKSFLRVTRAVANRNRDEAIRLLQDVLGQLTSGRAVSIRLPARGALPPSRFSDADAALWKVEATRLGAELAAMRSTATGGVPSGTVSHLKLQGDAALEGGSVPEAVSLYTRAIAAAESMSPQVPIAELTAALCCRSRCYFRLSQYVDAEADARRAAALDANSYQAAVRLGNALEAQLKWKDAAKSYRHARELGPTPPSDSLMQALQRCSDVLERGSARDPGSPYREAAAVPVDWMALPEGEALRLMRTRLRLQRDTENFDMLVSWLRGATSSDSSLVCTIYDALSSLLEAHLGRAAAYAALFSIGARTCSEAARPAWIAFSASRDVPVSTE